MEGNNSKMNILKGKLNKKQMAKFAGVETLSEIDKSLARLADQGYLEYKKIKGGEYQFVLYPEPVKEIRLNSETD